MEKVAFELGLWDVGPRPGLSTCSGSGVGVRRRGCGSRSEEEIWPRGTANPQTCHPLVGLVSSWQEWWGQQLSAPSLHGSDGLPGVRVAPSPRLNPEARSPA